MQVELSPFIFLCNIKIWLTSHFARLYSAHPKRGKQNNHVHININLAAYEVIIPTKFYTVSF